MTNPTKPGEFELNQALHELEEALKKKATEYTADQYQMALLSVAKAIRNITSIIKQ